MILNFIIVFVFLFLFMSMLWNKEGFNPEPPPLDVDCTSSNNYNIKLPIYNKRGRSILLEICSFTTAHLFAPTHLVSI